MKTGSEFHVGIVGLGSMGMGAALSCVRAGLSTWGADLNSNACATLKEAGACGVSDNAATFAEKLDALLVLVDEHAAEGTIWLTPGDDELTPEQAIEQACQEVQRETPMGAYAVEYITYTVSQDNRPYSEIKLALGYRRTEEQVKSIVHATSISALHALLTAAAETSAEELVVQVGYFQDQAQEVRDIAVQVEQEVLGAEEPTWQVEFYPNESAAGIIEILMKN